MATLVWGTGDAGELQDPDARAAALDAVREFKRFFRKYKEVAEKVAAVETLEGMECPEAAEELVDLLDHPEKDVRGAAMRVLTSYKQDETFAAWVGTLPEISDAMQQARLVEVLGRAKIRSAVAPLRQLVVEGDAKEDVLYEVAHAMARIGDPAVEPEVAMLLASPHTLVRMAAADTVATLRLKALGPKLLPLFGDESWQVQSAAIKAAGVVRPAEAVEPLIELMRETGRLREEAADALFLITTLDFGANPDEWAKQWAKLQELDWKLPTDEDVAKAKAARARSDAYYGKKGEHNTFAGIPTTSTRVLFIIDVSGSMDDLVVEKEKFDAGYDDYRKLTIVKEELANTIDGLSKNTFFNVVAFATDLKTWKNRLVPANITNRSSAKAFVERLKALGGVEDQQLAQSGLTGAANLEAGKTNTFKALMHIFGEDPEKPSRAARTGSRGQAVQNGLDTVYFLSDGRPSTGVLVDTKEIVAAVTRENEAWKIVIHCIAIGEFQRSFLKTLAEQNGGVFVDLGR